MVNRIINYEAAGAAGVEDGVISVFSTRAVEVGGREWLCVKGCPEDGFAFAICTLMDYSIIDLEVMDILGDAQSLVSTNEGEGVVTAVARIVAHPFPSWMVSIPFFGLSGGVRHPCWVSGSSEESGWGIVDRVFIFSLHVWFDDVSEDGDVAEVQEVVEGIVRDEDRVSRLTTPAHDSDGRNKVVSPLFDDIKWGGVSCSVSYDTSCHSLHILYLLLARWDVVFALGSRWGNRGNGFTDFP